MKRGVKIRIVVLLILSVLTISKGYNQPLFYSQTLQKLYYSLPESCRIENPVADTVVSCTGILQGITIPVAYGADNYGVLAHVGYRFLQGGTDTLLYSAVVRFLERETLALLATGDLEKKLTTNRENGLILLHNGNTPQRVFYRDRNGLPYLLQHVSGMDIRYDEGKRYRVSLNCGTGQIIQFQFVANAELLSDMDKKERDERLAAQLKHHRAKFGATPPHVPACSGASMQPYRDSVLVCMGSSFIIPQMNNNLYYLKTGDTFNLVSSGRWAAETLANVMLASAGHDYTIHMVHRQYGGEVFRYEVKSRDFYDYFSGNYERYFGIESLDRGRLSGTLILADRNAGSIHLAFVSVGLWELLTGGVMEIQLDSNIPQHNLETLFGRKIEDKNKHQ